MLLVEITLSVRFITLSVRGLLRYWLRLHYQSGLLHYRLRYNIISLVYYIISQRFITLLFEILHYQSGLLHYRLRYNIISQVYYVIG